jgi:hypothetical protein
MLYRKQYNIRKLLGIKPNSTYIQKDYITYIYKLKNVPNHKLLFETYLVHHEEFNEEYGCDEPPFLDEKNLYIFVSFYNSNGIFYKPYFTVHLMGKLSKYKNKTLCWFAPFWGSKKLGQGHPRKENDTDELRTEFYKFYQLAGGINSVLNAENIDSFIKCTSRDLLRDLLRKSYTFENSLIKPPKNKYNFIFYSSYLSNLYNLVEEEFSVLSKDILLEKLSTFDNYFEAFNYYTMFNLELTGVTKRQIKLYDEYCVEFHDLQPLIDIAFELVIKEDTRLKKHIALIA